MRIELRFLRNTARSSCLVRHLVCSREKGCSMKGLNNFETAEVIKSCIFIWILRKHLKHLLFWAVSKVIVYKIILVWFAHRKLLKVYILPINLICNVGWVILIKTYTYTYGLKNVVIFAFPVWIFDAIHTMQNHKPFHFDSINFCTSTCALFHWLLFMFIACPKFLILMSSHGNFIKHTFLTFHQFNFLE